MDRIVFEDNRLNSIIYDRLNFDLSEDLNIYNVDSLFELYVDDCLIESYKGIEILENLDTLVLDIRDSVLIDNIAYLRSLSNLKELILNVYYFDFNNIETINSLLDEFDCDVTFNLFRDTLSSFSLVVG